MRYVVIKEVSYDAWGDKQVWYIVQPKSFLMNIWEFFIFRPHRTKKEALAEVYRLENGLQDRTISREEIKQ